LADVVDLATDAGAIVATHSVFGGAYTVRARVDGGPAVITVRQGAIQERLAAVEPTVTTATIDVPGAG
jgi:electron transfer flavoprotein alpha subunit